MNQRMHSLRFVSLTGPCKVSLLVKHATFYLHFYIIPQSKNQILVHHQSKSFSQCEFLTVNALISIVWSSSELRRRWHLSTLAIISFRLNHMKRFFETVSGSCKICYCIFNNRACYHQHNWQSSLCRYNETMTKKYIKE